MYKVPFKTQTQRSLLLFAAIAVTALFSSIASASDEAAEYALGKKLFTIAVLACAICLTLKDAGSEGAVGPIPDKIKPNSARVNKALSNRLGNMPSYKALLSEAEIAVVSLYVVNASGVEK